MFPTLFKIGPFIVSTIWVFIAIATYVYLKLLVKLIQKKRGDFRFLYEHSTYLIAAFVIGARLTYVALNFSYYFYDYSLRSFLSVFALWDKGFSFWGGLIFIIIALFRITRKNKESFKKWMDYITEPFLYVLPITYLGKFFDGMGYGSKTDLPIGITFTNMNVAIISPVHPTQLYGGILILLAIGAYKKLNDTYYEYFKIPGVKAATIIALISIVLFIEHLFRGDPTFMIFDLRFTLYLSIITLCASMAFIYKTIKNNS